MKSEGKGGWGGRQPGHPATKPSPGRGAASSASLEQQEHAWPPQPPCGASPAEPALRSQPCGRALDPAGPTSLLPSEARRLVCQRTKRGTQAGLLLPAPLRLPLLLLLLLLLGGGPSGTGPTPRRAGSGSGWPESTSTAAAAAGGGLEILEVHCSSRARWSRARCSRARWSRARCSRARWSRARCSRQGGVGHEPGGSLRWAVVEWTRPQPSA